MSATLVTYEGYSGLMAMIARGITLGTNNTLVHLFVDATTPLQTWDWTFFTECTIPGYAPLPIPAGIDVGLNSNNIDTWRFDVVNFGPYAPSGQLIYGYWVDFTNPMTALRQSLWCQRFDVPFAFVAPGQVLPLVLTPGIDQGPTWIPKILTADNTKTILTDDK